eukprot:scaffold13475_cov103-Cylindrotheca_fusiformis.AAC.3
MAKSFGRDEMNDLLGASSSKDELASYRPPTATQEVRFKKKIGPKAEPDVASMTPAETAAMLMKKSTASLRQEIVPRHRTSRVFAHHALAEELLEESHRKKILTSSKTRQDASDSDDDFTAMQYPAGSDEDSTQRAGHHAKAAVFVRRKDRDVYASSSSDSEEDNEKYRHQNFDDTSTDDDYEHRRRKLRASRIVGGAEIVKPRAISSTHASAAGHKRRIVQPPPQLNKSKLGGKTTKDSSESQSETSSSSSSESSSESEVESFPIRAKPVFIPKRRRTLVQSEEQKMKEEESWLERETTQEQRRKRESRALVARQLAAIDTGANVDLNEESNGAINSMPDDTDDVSVAAKEYIKAVWELRELQRLLAVLYEEEERERTRMEYKRRRKMTDEEVMEEDIEGGRYDKRRIQKPQKVGTHRFYQRGSYYMNDDEYDSNGIRFKAAEYASEYELGLGYRVNGKGFRIIVTSGNAVSGWSD